MVSNGEVPHDEKYSNDKADNAANLGAMREDEHLNCLARKYSHKQRMYGVLMIRVQKSLFACGRLNGRWGNGVKMTMNPSKDPEKEKVLIPSHF